uniref:Trimethylguanosine synthase n=1 Tax=Henneguya salminicola TaxID=69463 RepID=A0A6G3MJU4_HENSL
MVDPFCGCGGNVIQFAKTCGFVIGGDHDIEKIKLCVNNTKVYGLSNNVDYIVADALYLIKCIRLDVLFLSPPWGGPSYKFEDTFSVEEHLNPNAFEIIKSLNESCYRVAMFLPKNVSIKPLKKISKKYFDGSLEYEKNQFNKKIVAVTIYFNKHTNM